MFGLLVAVSFAGLRIGEIGVDTIKSIRPLLIILGPRSGDTLIKIRDERQRLSARVVEVIHTFGSETFHELEREDSDAIGFSIERSGDLPANELESPAEDPKASRSRAASNATGDYRHPYYGSSSARTGFTRRTS